MPDAGWAICRPLPNPCSRRGPPAPEFVTQLAEVLRVPLEVLQFYAGRLPPGAQQERRDPSHEQIVAAYRAFRRELHKKSGD
jgi:hypothetical protein